LTTLDSPAVMYDAAPYFFDARSGTRFEFHTPFARPDLWQQYLDGAETTYRAYGVEEALELETIGNGLSTTLFMVGLSPAEEVVAGVRFQGPILDPSEAHVSVEFAGSAGEGKVFSALAERIPHGVIEFKGCWAQVGHVDGRALSDAVARSFVHAMRWLNVRYGCCSAAAYATSRWQSSGGQVMADLETVPYPTDEYETTLLWWDNHDLADYADPQQWQTIELEWPQIEQSGAMARLATPDLLSLG
jgi:hypothetical protein